MPMLPAELIMKKETLAAGPVEDLSRTRVGELGLCSNAC